MSVSVKVTAGQLSVTLKPPVQLNVATEYESLKDQFPDYKGRIELLHILVQHHLACIDHPGSVVGKLRLIGTL